MHVDGAESIEFGRGLSFIDAIYGFAITLLVINPDVPKPSDWTDLGTLAESGLGGQLLGFTLSFVVIAAFWRLNYRMVRTMSGMTPSVLTANLVCTFFVVLIPFATQGISDPATVDLGLPTAFYALNVAGVAVALRVMFVLAQVQGLTGPVPDRRDLVVGLLATVPVPLVFLASVPVAIAVGAEPARWMWLSLIVIGPLAGRFGRYPLPRDLRSGRPSQQQPVHD